jgi:molecular chaperone HscA
LLLDATERSQVEAALAELRRVVAGNDADAVRRGILALEQTCGFYVERRMNKGIQAAMAGQRVDEFR